MLDAEKAAALSAPQASRLSSDREQAVTGLIAKNTQDLTIGKLGSQSLEGDVAELLVGVTGGTLVIGSPTVW